MRRVLCALLLVGLLVVGSVPILAASAPSSSATGAAGPTTPVVGIMAEASPQSEPTPKTDLAPDAAEAVLMDASSGQVLWSKNANVRRPAASVTKLMTMAIVMDSIDSGRIRWNDLVSATQQAVETGGSQIWLELGETMTVRDLFYAVAVQSANDAAVALAEFVGGTEPAFIEMMNNKAKALGMRNTLYTDPTGLDDQNQYTSAYDVALLSRYLVIDEPQVLQYTGTWEYRLRGEKLWLVNRNKLLKQLPGVDGLKTGFTTAAGYCLSATAQRGSTRLIAVVLGATTSDARFNETSAMLQWGFTHYATVAVSKGGTTLKQLPVDGGAQRTVAVGAPSTYGVTVPRGSEGNVRSAVILPQVTTAPVKMGQEIGQIQITVSGKEVATVPLVALRAVPRLGFGGQWVRVWRGLWPWPRP